MSCIRFAVNMISGCTYVQELDAQHHQIIVDGVTRVLRTSHKELVAELVERIRRNAANGVPGVEKAYTKADMEAMFGKGYMHGCREGGDVATAFEKALASIAK